MPDQRLTAKNGVTEVALGAVLESDDTPSLQVADREGRAHLASLVSSMGNTITSLDAAAQALTLAANAEQVQTDVVLANVASLIAAASLIQAEATTLEALLGDQIDALTDTQALITQMALAMQVSFSTLEDVRGVVQELLNGVAALIGQAIPGVSYDPVGHVEAGELVATAAGVETILAQLTVAADSAYSLAGFTASGNGDARFNLYIGTERVLGARTSPTTRTVFAAFPDRARPLAAANLIVKLTVVGLEVGELCDFEGFIHGHHITP